jgi:hypothetical protein
VTGSALTIYGQNFGSFQGLDSVLFGSSYASIINWGPQQIIVTIPIESTNGTSNVSVSTGGPYSNSAAFTVLPLITEITPGHGAVGSQVVILGSALLAPGGSIPTVTFNGIASPTVQSITVIGSAGAQITAITAVVPSGAMSGNAVVSANGLSSNPMPFTVP